MSHTLDTRIQHKYDYASNWEKIWTTFVPLNGELIIFASDVSGGEPKLKVGNGTTTLEQLPWLSKGRSASTDKKIDPPTVVGTYTYTGSTITPTFNVSAAGCTVSGDTSGTNAGQYTATFTLNSGYSWSDGSTGVKTLNWTIGKATPTITMRQNTFQYGSFDSYGSLGYSIQFSISPSTFDFDAGYFYLKNTSDNSVVYESMVFNMDGNMEPLPVGTYELSAVITTSGTVYLEYAGDSNFNSFKSPNFSLVNQLSNLGMCSWQQISEISKSGKASSYWSIGDYKAIENSLIPNALAFIVDFGTNSENGKANPGIMFEINCWNLLEITSSSNFYAFTRSYGSRPTDTGHGLDYSNVFCLHSDFGALDYAWNDPAYETDPLWNYLDTLYYYMGSSIQPYIREITETSKEYRNNSQAVGISHITIPTAYQIGLATSGNDYSSWSGQFDYYTASGNTSASRKYRYGSAYSSASTGYWYQTNSNSKVEYWVRPLDYYYGTYNYVTTSGTLGSVAYYNETSKGITPIFVI